MKNRMRGLSLIELMVSLAIGSLLIVGAVFVYSQSRRTYAVNEAIARLQENARYVLSLIEPDIQLAGYYGFTNSPDSLVFMAGGADTATTSATMQTASPPVPTLAASAQECGNNFAVNLLASIEGGNNTYPLPPLPSTCAAQGGGARATTDTLTLRRASICNPDPNGDGSTADSTCPVAQAGRLQLQINRLGSIQHVFAGGILFGSLPLTVSVTEQLRDLVVRTYYISQDSASQAGVPTLRVKSLIRTAAGPAFSGTDLDTGLAADTEIMAGVEDLQVQFGIDNAAFNGVTTRYINPVDAATLAGAQVTAVRIWLMLRAEQPEQGFVDTRNYVYADKNYTPAGADQGFRRVLISRTIRLRNARMF